MLDAKEKLNFFDEFRELCESPKFVAEEFSGDPVELTNPVCGDWVGLWLALDKNCCVAKYEYQQKGCWPVAGCLELLGEIAIGAPAKDLLSYSFHKFTDQVEGIPVSKRHAFSLAHRALQQCLIRELSRQK